MTKLFRVYYRFEKILKSAIKNICKNIQVDLCLIETGRKCSALFLLDML